jgi:hypothetical protein
LKEKGYGVNRSGGENQDQITQDSRYHREGHQPAAEFMAEDLPCKQAIPEWVQ